MSALPRRVEFGYACAIEQTHGVRSSDCIGAARQHRHAAVTSMPQNWPLEWVVRPPLRIFNPPLICLSHPALNRKWSLRVVTLHGLPVICRRLYC